MKQWKHVEGRLEAAARHDPIHKRSTSSTPSVTHIWYNVLKLVCGTPGCWMQSGNEIPIIWPVCERSAASPACHIRQPPSSSGATKTNAILTPYQTTLGKLNAKNCGSIQLRKSPSTERNSPWRQALPTTKTCDHTMRTVFCAAIASMPLFLCQANTALFQRCPSTVAKYCAKF